MKGYQLRKTPAFFLKGKKEGRERGGRKKKKKERFFFSWYSFIEPYIMIMRFEKGFMVAILALKRSIRSTPWGVFFSSERVPTIIEGKRVFILL